VCEDPLLHPCMSLTWQLYISYISVTCEDLSLHPQTVPVGAALPLDAELARRQPARLLVTNRENLIHNLGVASADRRANACQLHGSYISATYPFHGSYISATYPFHGSYMSLHIRYMAVTLASRVPIAARMRAAT